VKTATNRRKHNVATEMTTEAMDSKKLAEMCADSDVMMSILDDIEYAKEETLLGDQEATVLVLRAYGFRREDIVELLDSLNTEDSVSSAVSRANRKISRAEAMLEFEDELDDKPFAR